MRRAFSSTRTSVARRSRDAALARVVEVGGRLLEPRVRPRARRARLAPGSSRSAARAADGRRGCARRQQQRRRRPPRARRARGGARGRRLARGADRDRRRLPDPRCPRALGRTPRRGRNDEPHARVRLRARDRPRHGRPAPCAPVELPRRRVLRATAAEPSSPPSHDAHEIPLVDDLGSGALAPWATSRPRPRASAPAPTSCASPATSFSAVRRPASSSAAPTSSSGSAAIRCSARFARTS